MKVRLIYILLFVTFPLFAQLFTYEYPAEARISNFYKVTVSQNGSVKQPTVLVSECPDGPF